MCREMNCFLVAILFSCCFQIVEGNGKIFFALNSYINPTHRLSNGRCCEQGIEPSCRSLPSCVNCTLECDNLFFIHMVHEVNRNVKVYDTIRTNVIAYTDTIRVFPKNLTNDISDPILNPISYDFHEYKGNFTINITSYDEDERDIDFVDGVSYTIDTSISTRRNYSHIKPYERTLIGNVSYLSITIWVSCDVNYYGDQCSKYCVGQDGENGHYFCENGTGEIGCLKGWENATKNCTEKVTYPTTTQTTTTQANMSIVLFLSLKGKYDETTGAKFFETLKNVIVQEINKKCLSLDGNTDQDGAEKLRNNDITMENHNFTSVRAYSKIIINLEGKKYQSGVRTCSQKAIYESQLLYDLLQVTSVEVCKTTTSCKSGFTKRKKTDEKKDYTTLIVVVSAVAVTLAITILFTVSREKRSKKSSIHPGSAVGATTAQESNIATTTNKGDIATTAQL